MKVLQINATYASGSTGTIVRDIQRCCEDNGIEGYVVYSLSCLPEEQVPRGYRMGNVVSNKLHALLSRVNGRQAYFSVCSTFRLLKYLDRLHPDVIHLHNLHSNFIHLNMLLSYIAEHRIATVVTLHDCWYFTGGCPHFVESQCFRWLEHCGHCPRKKLDTPVYFLDRTSSMLRDRYRYFNAIGNLTAVGVSDWIASEAHRGVFKNKRCIHIHNGVDTSIFRPVPSDLRTRFGIGDRFVILGPASKWLDPVNAEVLKTVCEGMDPDMVLLLFGCISPLPSLPDKVITFGYTANKEELAQLYTMADVFANCTRADSLSSINIEAQACGLPIVTFANTGVRETVNPFSGHLVENGDAASMLEKIKSVRASYGEIDRTRIVRWIEEHFDKKRNYEKYVDLYRQITEK